MWSLFKGAWEHYVDPYVQALIDEPAVEMEVIEALQQHGVLVVPGHDLRSVREADRADLRYHEFVAVPAVQAGAD